MLRGFIYATILTTVIVTIITVIAYIGQDRGISEETYPIQTASPTYTREEPAQSPRIEPEKHPSVNITTQTQTPESYIPKIGKLAVRIKQNMDYEEARKLLLADGWQTAVMHRIASYGYPVCYNHEYSTDCNGYYEIEDCSSTGMGYCSMFFYDGSGTYLHVITHGGGPPDAIIDGWGEASAEDVVQRRVNNHSFLPPDAPPATTPQPAVTANYASSDTTSNKNNDADIRTKDSSGQESINPDNDKIAFEKKCGQILKDALYYSYIRSICLNKPTQSSDAFMRMFLGKFLVTSPNCLEVSLENHLEKFDTDIQQSISKMRYEKGHTVFCEEEQPYIDKLKKKYKL